MVADRRSLRGSTMVGYQGWFNCPNDGLGLGWKHWAKDKTKPVSVSNCVIDFLPDISEFDVDELCATMDMTNANGEPVQLFSSANRKTVLRHFQWMQDYGIDGVFLQRFGNGLHDRRYLRNYNTVLDNVIAGAGQYGRTFVVMYDLSGMKNGAVCSTIYDDWQSIEDRVLTQSDRYQFHNNKPLVAIWGIGFKERPYALEECHRLVEALANRGCSIMLGLPTGWRELKRDSVTDPFLHEIVQLANVVSPWSKCGLHERCQQRTHNGTQLSGTHKAVGRYRSPKEAKTHAERYWVPDLAWCQDHHKDYMPVAFPGFSWHNLKCRQHCPLDEIPRLKGDFFWSQVEASLATGCIMLYIAMFDEVDEGTAIFKCTNDVDQECFCTYEGLPSDHYLLLAGKAAHLFQKKAWDEEELVKDEKC